MKIFTVAVIMMIVATVTVPNEATDARLDVDYMEEFPTIHSRCPPNVTADFDVIFNGEDSSTVKGCASLEFRSRHNSNEMKMFSLKFGRLNNGVCVSGDYADVDQLMFSCTPQSAMPPLEFDNGKVYILNGLVLKPAGKIQTRCVLYKMTNSVMDMMAVSGTTSCEGLSRMMFYSKATPLKGSMLLRLNKPRDNLRHKRSTSEDKNSTQLNFSGSRYYWVTG
ncbi:uncharacterized protein LOC132937557 [Metopolophium dirhodum]|uniref:uncharacterized protein LOC132934292 n=1 Tax=Metopolophium dirhodum TaxID=44670 RepID=UPI00298FAE86|nr:uncharacterized protein LOC132934292 [Metopolophium dirhodum]XP_060860361.1 uncharacterized protein LOC132937555 [Metopolophium dirhodum]XP_060860362.1 uncharacterized protein LOC132937557 [Metopolophium dirhodum]